jgi:Rrf2 family protein
LCEIKVIVGKICGGRRGADSQVQEYAILLVVEPYLLEIVPLDGCNWIGDNDVGLFWSEIWFRMLKLTKKADYGLIALKHLAVNAPASSSAKEIAETYGIPGALLSKILQKLVKNGFLRSEHGTNGGYKLARDPREITAYEVIRTIDGPIFLTACFTEHGYCVHTDKCTVRDPLQKVHEGILRLLASISISDMSAESPKTEARPEDDVSKSAQRLYDVSMPPTQTPMQ